MPREVNIHPRTAIDSDDKVATVSAPAATNGTLLVFSDTGLTNFRTRTGRKARLVFVGNAVDPGGETDITFHVLVNGARLRPPYDAFSQAMGETFNAEASMAVPVELPQNALIQVSADNADVSTAFNVFARLRVEYEELN